MASGGLNPVCGTVVWLLTFTVENVFEKKKWKKPSLRDGGMVTGEPGQKPDWKKWPCLSDSDTVTGGLISLSKIGNQFVQKTQFGTQLGVASFKKLRVFTFSHSTLSPHFSLVGTFSSVFISKIFFFVRGREISLFSLSLFIHPRKPTLSAELLAYISHPRDSFPWEKFKKKPAMSYTTFFENYFP